MAALNLSGKTSGYIKLTAPDVATNATVELPNKDGILATLDDIGSGGGSGGGEVTGTPSSFARIVDEKPQGTDGGSTIAGTQDRTLNKIEYDTDNIITLDNNEFTLQAGTYVIDYSAPAHRVEGHNASLYDVTLGQKVSQGTTMYQPNPETGMAVTHSKGTYSVTLTKAHTYKIQHYTANVKDANGFGIKSDSGTSIFTTVNIQKVGTGGGSGGGGSVETVNAPAFRAELSELIQINKNETLKLPFNTLAFDSDNAFDVTNHRYTPTVAGYYYFTLTCRFGEQDFSGARHGSIWKNGSEAEGVRVFRQGACPTGSSSHSGSALIYMNGTTDYVEFYVVYGDGVNPLNIESINGWTCASGVLVKPANSGTLVGGDPVTLESLGIPNHDKVTVDENGTIGFSNPTTSRIAFSETTNSLSLNVGQWGSKNRIEGSGGSDLLISNNDATNSIVFNTGSAGGNKERMVIDADGKIIFNNSVFVNTRTPSYIGNFTGSDGVSTFNQSGITLTAYGTIAGFYYDRINFNTGTYHVVNQDNVGVYLNNGTTSWTSTSDEKLKNITGNIENALESISKLRTVRFNWKYDEKKTSQVGLIAQDVQKVLPEIVSESADGTLGIRYTETIPLLVRAIQELDDKTKIIDKLLAKVEALEEKLKKVK
jgi:hypothetical protein